MLPYQLTRPLQIAFLLLLVVSCAQVGWWIVDQFAYTAEVRSAQRRAYDADAPAARALLRTGTGWTDVHRLYPHLRLGPGSAVSVAPDVLRDLDHERFHRLNRYAWEGGFFLLVLLGAMAVVYRTLEEEAALRRRQEAFLAAVSHELRSPMAAVIGAARTLQARWRTLGAEQRDERVVLPPCWDFEG